MFEEKLTRNLLVAACLAAAGMTVASAFAAAENETVQSEPALAAQVLEAAGVQGGLVVHLGCGDGKLTAALRAGGSYLVQGLDADPQNIAKAREHLQGRGPYGPVSVDHFDGLIAAEGRLYLAALDGKLVCFGAPGHR